MATVLLVQATPGLGGDWWMELEAGEITVLAVDSVDDGIAGVRDGGIDLVVIDGVSLPALIRMVTALGLLPDAPPFVLVSAHPEAPSMSARLGAAAFVAKPCRTADLCAVLRDRLQLAAL